MTADDWQMVATILPNETIGAVDVLINSAVRPPLNHISITVEHSSTIIESMRQFMSKYTTNRTVIQSPINFSCRNAKNTTYYFIHI